MKKAISVFLVLVMVFALALCGAQPAYAEESFKGTLEYWSSWNENEAQAQILIQAAKDFQELYPDVTINFTWSGDAVWAIEEGADVTTCAPWLWQRWRPARRSTAWTATWTSTRHCSATTLST